MDEYDEKKKFGKVLKELDEFILRIVGQTNQSVLLVVIEENSCKMTGTDDLMMTFEKFKNWFMNLEPLKQKREDITNTKKGNSIHSYIEDETERKRMEVVNKDSLFKKTKDLIKNNEYLIFASVSKDKNTSALYVYGSNKIYSEFEKIQNDFKDKYNEASTEDLKKKRKERDGNEDEINNKKHKV